MMALSVVRRSKGSGGLRRGKTIVIVAAVVACLSSAAPLVLCDGGDTVPVPPPEGDEGQKIAGDDLLKKKGLLRGDESKHSDEDVAFAHNVRAGFVTSLAREEFTVLDPNSVVTGAGREETLPDAVLETQNRATREGLGVLHRVAGKGNSAKSDVIRKVLVKETWDQVGVKLTFEDTEDGSKCYSKNFGARARVTDVETEGKYLTVFYQQYDASGHVFLDEEMSVTAKEENIIRGFGGAEVVEKGTLIALLCKEYRSDVLLHIGWPNPIPVYRMDHSWSMKVKVTRITTTVAPSGNGTIVIAMLQRLGSERQDMIVDPDTQLPIEGVFMYVGKGKSWSKAYDVLASDLEGQECVLDAKVGKLRPDLNCSLSSTDVSDSHLRAAARARRAKIATSVAAAALGTLGGLLLFPRLPTAAHAVPWLLFLGAVAGAVGSKVRQDKLAKIAAQQLRPPKSRRDDEEHIVFIKADSYGPPTEEENSQRKVKLLLDYAREKQLESEEAERLKRRENRRAELLKDRADRFLGV